MAHLSGYDGAITFSTSTAGLLDNLLAQITAWTLRQTQDTFLVFAKQEAWKVRFGTAKEWEADIEFLIQQDTIVNSGLVGANFTALTLIASDGTTDLAWVGTAGVLSGLEISDPLDGPVTARGTIGGSVALTQTIFS